MNKRIQLKSKDIQARFFVCLFCFFKNQTICYFQGTYLKSKVNVWENVHFAKLPTKEGWRSYINIRKINFMVKQLLKGRG